MIFEIDLECCFFSQFDKFDCLQGCIASKVETSGNANEEALQRVKSERYSCRVVTNANSEIDYGLGIICVKAGNIKSLGCKCCLVYLALVLDVDLCMIYFNGICVRPSFYQGPFSLFIIVMYKRLGLSRNNDKKQVQMFLSGP